MTREECIEILDKYVHHSRSEVIIYPRKVATEAFEMAIAALKAESCEDAVSRTDTLQSFESYCEKNCQYSKKQRDVMCRACMMGDAIEIVESLPPVTSKPTRCEDAVSKAIKTITNYCSERTCTYCRLFSSEGCIFKCGYPHEWLEVQEELEGESE